MNTDKGGREKRKSPRYYLELPIEYRVTNAPDAYGGVVVDGSEIGLRIQSVKNLPVGTKLNVGVIFPKEFEMINFEVMTEIVWKELYWREDWNGYQYGLKFLQILNEDFLKLKKLLKEQLRKP